jgi:hypothetical protein
VQESSDSSAQVMLDRIEAAGQQASFSLNSSTGLYQAVLLVDQQTLDTFELYPGDTAFGQLDLQIELRSVDSQFFFTDVSDALVGQVTVNITPEVDAPLLTANYTSIVYVDNHDIPLLLDFSLVNPAPGETGEITISGLPDSFSLSAGVKQGADWKVESEDIAGLMINATDVTATENFSLTITPTATLGGDSADGSAVSIAVTVSDDTAADALSADTIGSLLNAGVGSDSISLAAGGDRVIFSSGDEGSIGSAENDSIAAFDVANDIIDIADMLAGIGNASYELVDNGGNSRIDIYSDSDVVQSITLESIDFDNLYGGTGYSSAEDVLQKMIDDNALIVA